MAGRRSLRLFQRLAPEVPARTLSELAGANDTWTVVPMPGVLVQRHDAAVQLSPAHESRAAPVQFPVLAVWVVQRY